MLDRLGVGSLAERGVTALSGGEASGWPCAALAHGPRLVLADGRPGSWICGRPIRCYDALAAAVADAGAALVLVSHDPRAARVADRVVRIRDGRFSETSVSAPLCGSGVRSVARHGSRATRGRRRGRAGVRHPSSLVRSMIPGLASAA